MEKKKILLEKLITFLKTEPACQDAFHVLSPKAEIEIIVGGANHLRLRPDQDQIKVEEQKALAPDFVFSATPAAIEVLVAETGLTPSQLALKLIKQMLNQEVTLSMPVSPFVIPRKGYFNLIKLGGVELLNELRKYNLHSVPKILAAIKRIAKG